MDGRPTWTDCDESGDYVVPNVLSPRDLVFRPDNMDETVPHTHFFIRPASTNSTSELLAARVCCIPLSSYMCILRGTIGLVLLN